ncbi:MAG: aminoacyl-histidine dipeptidase [Lachnospiraceae bacterium]|nr:aminoacyl-histidine dipeptidase [Lachnospiraceae bacterium]
MADRILKDLQPEKVFRYFEEICGIPHGSHNIRQISDYLTGWAEERGLSCTQEPCGNVIVRVPATPGYEQAQTVILQGHMDMVAVKDADCGLDMERDGLELLAEGDYISAKGTSLGGDDGIALAYGLAIADSDDIPHPPLELLFTVNEETGMDGARELDVRHLQGRTLINIDSEEEGTLLVGCAGGARVDISGETEKAPAEGSRYRITLSGMQGGHSGAEIHKNRENAIAVLARALDRLAEQVPYVLAKLSGGSKDNVIPSEACADIFCTASPKKALEEVFAELYAELSVREPDMKLRCEEAAAVGDGTAAEPLRESGEGLSAASRDRLLSLLQLLPFGVVRMSAAMPGVVETSANIGTALAAERVQITCSVRSMIASARDQLCRQIALLAGALGYEVRVHGAYPGWQYRQESPLRETMVRVYEDMYGTKPAVEAIHAGLECGLFLEKLPELDCVSIGPDILDIHSTRERLSVSSTQRVWSYLLRVLAELR